MARARTLKLGFFTNDELGALPATTRLLFAGLWNIADREGRLLDRPRRIKAEVMPYDDIDPDLALEQLADAAFIQRYQVDGVALIQVTKWHKHQNPHPNEAASELPPPPLTDCPTDPITSEPLLAPEPTATTPLHSNGSASEDSGRSPVSGPLAFPSGPTRSEGGVGGPAAQAPPDLHNDDLDVAENGEAAPSRLVEISPGVHVPRFQPGNGTDRTDEEPQPPGVDLAIHTLVEARRHDFHDDDPTRTKTQLQRMQRTSGLSMPAFISLVDEQVLKTKDDLYRGKLHRNEAGQQKGWPVTIAKIRDALPPRRQTPRSPAHV